MSEITTQMLQFLASDEQALTQFFAETGLSPQDLRAQAQDGAFQAGLIEFFMQNESLLLNFCANHHIEISHIQRLYAQHTQFDASV